MKNLLASILKKYQALAFQLSPVFLTIVVLNQAISVKWLPNSEPDLAGYKVYYGKTSRSYSANINAGLTTECTISDLQPGYEYFFSVSAYDTAGNESTLSDEVSIFIEGNENEITADHNKAYNFPNPFNPEIQNTQLRFHLTKPEEVSITIFDVGGDVIQTIIKKIWKNSGEHVENSWDGKDEHGNYVSNGIYYAHISSESLDQYITIAVTK